MNLTDDEMQSLDAYLTAIERIEGITVIGAWVMGSHAHGVAHADSDIDVRFVYAHVFNPPSLTEDGSSLTYTGDDLHDSVPYADTLDTDLEFMGWDAERFLQLLGDRDDGNNPAVIECLMSPLTIRTHPVLADLRDYVHDHFNIIELYDHYRGFAKRNWKEYVEGVEEPQVKKLVYILRGVLFARYIRDTHTLPTLDLPAFLDAAPDSVFDGFDEAEIRALVDRKQAGEGDAPAEPEPFAETIAAFIDAELDYQQHIREDAMDGDRLERFMAELFRDSDLS